MLEVSLYESQAFGFNFCRADSSFLSLDKSEQETIIKQHAAAVIRFAIDADRQDLLARLYENFSEVYFFSTVLNYYADSNVWSSLVTYYDCELREASTADRDKVEKLVTDIYKEHTIGYFRVPFLQHRLNAEKELEAMKHFILSYLGEENKGIQFLVSKEEKSAIGFASYSISGDVVYRPYAGILEKYWNNKYYEQLIYHMIEYNFTKGFKGLTFGVRADNLPLINKYNRLRGRMTSIQYVFLTSAEMK